MTHHEQQLRQAFRDSGLGFQRMTFAQAMAVPAIRTVLAIQVDDRQKNDGKQAPVQPALI